MTQPCTAQNLRRDFPRGDFFRLPKKILRGRVVQGGGVMVKKPHNKISIQKEPQSDNKHKCNIQTNFLPHIPSDKIKTKTEDVPRQAS